MNEANKINKGNVQGDLPHLKTANIEEE